MTLLRPAQGRLLVLLSAGALTAGLVGCGASGGGDDAGSTVIETVTEAAPPAAAPVPSQGAGGQTYQPTTPAGTAQQGTLPDAPPPPAPKPAPPPQEVAPTPQPSHGTSTDG